MAISIITWLAALRYKASAITRPSLSPLPLYRIISESRDNFSARSEDSDVFRGRTDTQVTHRASRLEAGQ